LQAGQPCVFCIHYELNGLQPHEPISFGISISSDREQPLANLYSDFSEQYMTNLPERGIIKLTLSQFPFTTGTYLLGVRVVMGGTSQTGILVDWPQEPVSFQAKASDYYGTGNLQLPKWGH